ncbi:11073_t:CDS:2 [Racocetra persica]|uniref:11073_t:CDS:1 n=2 Tax=Gigasporaceae TaxID=36753 RepID=A0ACA9S5V1_9GLOM|nr:11073_t:CDS:2 [Racocetra persica]
MPIKFETGEYPPIVSAISLPKNIFPKVIFHNIETKSDKNNNPYFRLSLQGLPGHYFYAFSQDYNLKNTTTLCTLTEAPLNFINRPVLITYEEIKGRDNLPLYNDTLYNLVETLKKALKLLEDQNTPGQTDEYGEPIILEAGLCSLVDEFQEEEEDF